MRMTRHVLAPPVNLFAVARRTSKSRLTATVRNVNVLTSRSRSVRDLSQRSLVSIAYLVSHSLMSIPLPVIYWFAQLLSDCSWILQRTACCRTSKTVNEVPLLPARLVLREVTVSACRQIISVIKPATEDNSASYPQGTGNECQSAVTMCGCGVKTGMAHSVCGCTCGWQVNLCDLSLTCAIPERFVASQPQ